MIDLMCSFFVVSSGNPGPSSLRSNRVCAPNTDNVPVPVRSLRGRPSSSTSRSRSWYCRTAKFYRRARISRNRISLSPQFCHWGTNKTWSSWKHHVHAEELVNAVLWRPTNEPNRYIEIDGNGRADRFNFAGGVWSALHESFD